MSTQTGTEVVRIEIAAKARLMANKLSEQIDQLSSRREVAAYLGWSGERLRRFLESPMQMSVEEVLMVLFVLELPPGQFFLEVEKGFAARREFGEARDDS